eukprot:TRINITY_DN5620_c0_g1_i3.p1 TRINITY_DN5620_c0_g1~~TRINITY_DN5620_c0_g1_i3.p1  ORF type:complete len:323 (+),score=66.51 TRINITY_DN5620_c0_g1_i3:755-1723(+)
MINAGFKWGDGRTLQFYISREDVGKWQWFRTLASSSTMFLTFLAAGSLVMELFSIGAMFDPTVRLIIVVSAIGMHIGIWLVMNPEYFPQCVCYALAITWPGEVVLKVSALKLWAVPFASIASTYFFLFLIGVCFTKLEFWPFTGIPMYSYSRIGFDQKFLLREQVMTVIKEYVDSPYPWGIAWSPSWFVVKLEESDSKGNLIKEHDPVAVFPERKRAFPKHWRRLVLKVAAHDILDKNGIEYNGFNQNTVSVQFLKQLAQLYIQRCPKLLNGNKFTLKVVCRLKEKIGTETKDVIVGQLEINNQLKQRTIPNIGLWVDSLGR